MLIDYNKIKQTSIYYLGNLKACILVVSTLREETKGSRFEPDC